MKRKLMLALLLVTALSLPLSGCTHKQKKKGTKNVEDTSGEEKKGLASEIQERKVTDGASYKAVLGDYTVTFTADKGFVQSKEEQMPKESRDLGARGVKYTKESGEEIFLSYSPEEMTPNVGNATNAKEYMMLEDDGTTSKWAKDVEAGAWKGFHYKATTDGANMVGYDLYHEGQEIKISVTGTSDEEYPSLEDINIIEK